MIKKSLIFVLLIGLVTPLLAQQPPPATATQKFAWDMPAPSLADAQAYTYKYYPDGATTGIVFASVSCSGSVSPFVCSTPIPAFTPGNHTIEITATNIAGEGGKSSPFAFNFVVTPGIATGTRIISGN